MSLKHAILGFLKISPKTGYEIQKKIDFTIEHFWPTTQSQIYRTLKELEDEGLIQCELFYQEEKPNKKIYTLTENGESELIRWLSDPVKITPHRNQFLVQLFFSNNISPKIILANLSDYKRELEKRLNFLKYGEGQSRIALGQTAQERVLYQIIVDNGIDILESEIRWVEKSAGKLQELVRK